MNRNSTVYYCLYNLIADISPVNFYEVDHKDSPKNFKKDEIVVIIVEFFLKETKKGGFYFKSDKSHCKVYYETHWVNLDTQLIGNLLTQCALKLNVDSKLAKHHKFKDNLTSQILSVIEPCIQNDKDFILLNLENGTLQIEKDSYWLKNFDPKDDLDYKLNYCFDPKAKADLFLEFLDEVIPDKEKQINLQEFFGYLFISNLDFSLSKILVLYGEGANGKSVIYELASALLHHSNIRSYSIEKLTDNSGYARYDISGRILNYATEISKSYDINMIKKIASGEPIDIRQPYGVQMESKSYAKLIINCNELPTIFEYSNGFFRRLLILHFDKIITEDKQDPELSKKIIKNELPGILNWVLEGRTRLYRNRKFSACQSSKHLMAEYKKDSVTQFIEEFNYQYDNENYILQSDLYKHYTSFCQEQGIKPFILKKFKSVFQKNNFNIERKNSGMVIYTSRLQP
ncbi:DNA primase family protein [Flammeovirga aprica]|uniref:SF3 helicase domain-containing protein n=1 Tax=Flammeovirga aprica JL-4 TaxID=694437 RepID=A0A7X9RQB3_9BACT|nr:phage/plasmid primase, P4 family [Flammeovirga aprica]NME66588.1 hypothetical protein [Flammeovirga aprica JL-4]